MKSNREFIDGIYEKAKSHSVIEHEYRKKSWGRKSYLSIAAFLLLVCISIPTFRYSRIHSNSNGNNENNINPISLTEENQPITRSVRGIESAEEDVSVVLGEVLQIEDEEYMQAKIQIDRVFEGQVEDTIWVQCHMDESSNQAIFEVGEKVLLYLVKTESNDYELTDPFYGKYTLVDDNKGNEIYESQDGIKISLEELEIEYQNKE